MNRGGVERRLLKLAGCDLGSIVTVGVVAERWREEGRRHPSITVWQERSREKMEVERGA